MPKLLIFPSDLSATPQTPCPPTFRLKDIHREMFQPKNILQEKRFPERIRETPIRLKDSNPRLKHIPEPNPSAEMPTNKAFAGSLKDLKDFSGYPL